MKKFFVLLMCTILMMSMTVNAEEQTAEATVTYTCEDRFFVQIPDTIIVGEEVTITAAEVNISPNKTIYVDLMGNGDDHIQIHNEADESETIDVYFRDGNGNDLKTNNMTLASFTGEGETSTFSTYVNDTEGKKAGAYIGTAMFSIHCE